MDQLCRTHTWLQSRLDPTSGCWERRDPVWSAENVASSRFTWTHIPNVTASEDSTQVPDSLHVVRTHLSFNYISSDSRRRAEASLTEADAAIPRRASERLTADAVNPSSTRMFLAQLLMCLKRSGPNKMPPYQRDTTTITFRTSRICIGRQTHVKWARNQLPFIHHSRRGATGESCVTSSVRSSVWSWSRVFLFYDQDVFIWGGRTTKRFRVRFIYQLMLTIKDKKPQITVNTTRDKNSNNVKATIKQN